MHHNPHDVGFIEYSKDRPSGVEHFRVWIVGGQWLDDFTSDNALEAYTYVLALRLQGHTVSPEVLRLLKAQMRHQQH